MTRDDWQFATPLCWRRIVPKNPGVIKNRGGGWHHTCLKPMRYRYRDNTWVCVCGNEDSGLLIAARPATLAEAA